MKPFSISLFQYICVVYLVVIIEGVDLMNALIILIFLNFGV
jgi:hypothetical protein